MLFRMAAQNQQYAKAIDYGKQVADSGKRRRAMTSASSRRSTICRRTARTRPSGRTRRSPPPRKAGETPKENLYQFKLQCASDAGDNAGDGRGADGSDQAHQQDDLLEHAAAHRAPGRARRSQHADDLPHHVQHQLDERRHRLHRDGAASGRCGSARRGRRRARQGDVDWRHQGRAQGAHHAPVERPCKTRAEADKKGLAQQEAEANKSAAGELDVKLGEVYYGFGDYQKAADAINKGLQKGQIKHQDEAYVYLGLADAQLKNYRGGQEGVREPQERTEHQPARVEAVDALRRRSSECS